MEIFLICALVYFGIGLLWTVFEGGDWIMIFFWLPWLIMCAVVLIALAGKGK